MTTEQIEAKADPSNLRLADFNIKSELKFNVIPEFMEDVGYTTWRRRYVSTTLSAGASFIDIPATTTKFSHLKEVFLYPASMTNPSLDTPLPFIGEEPREVLAGKANTIPGTPSGYWLESDGSVFRRIYFNAPADVAYTCAYFYDTHIQFNVNNETENVELNGYIPEQFQWALVEGLKREMYRHRNGVGDTSFQIAAQAFEAWKLRAKKSPELTQKRRALYAR